MSDRPILFSAPMVKAILAGRKTQTRRLVQWPIEPNGIKYDTATREFICQCDYLPPSEMVMHVRKGKDRYLVAQSEGFEHECPHGQPSDRLWVKETWRAFERPEDGVDGVLFAADGAFQPIEDSRKAADAWLEAAKGTRHKERLYTKGSWRPAIFMPRWASRIALEIAEVRVERLRSISEADARAEGVELGKMIPAEINGKPGEVMIFDPRKAFAVLWDQINGGRAPFATDPWVWVISFARVRG